jgi:hypothetical protein
MAPKGETNRVYTKLSHIDASLEMIAWIKSCWTRGRQDFGGDEIYGRESNIGGMFSVTLGRDHMDIPFMPFAIISMIKGGERTYFSIHEGEVKMRSKWDLANSLEYWLSGKRACLKDVSDH